MLIDTGEKGFGKEIAARCAEQGIEKLDYLILTHFDQDHVGGAARVLRELPVGCVLQSCYPKKSVEYTHYLKALRRAGLEPVTVRGELSFTLDGVVFTVNAPRLERYADSPSNNSSLIVTVECGDCRLLFLGDAENARLSEWLESDPAPCAFVKLPHHGAWHSALVRLMEELRPGCALITSSEEEPESPKTLDLLALFSVDTYFTREAPVALFCNGSGVTLSYVEG